MATKRIAQEPAKNTVWIDNRGMASRIVAFTHVVDGKEQRVQQVFTSRTISNVKQGRTEISVEKWALMQAHRDQWEQFHSDDQGCFLRECTPAEAQADAETVAMLALAKKIEIEKQRARAE